MATRRQIAANRRNAQLCQGPTSPAGRAISSMNALKTGIDAKSEILPTENPADLAELTAEYYNSHAPATSEERDLVDKLICNEWLSRRYRRAEAVVWEKQLSRTNSPSLGAAFVAASPALCRVGRRQNAAHRDFQTALTKLLAFQAARQQDLLSQPSETKPLNHELDSNLIFMKPASAPPPSRRESPDPATTKRQNPPPVLDSTFGP